MSLIQVPSKTTANPINGPILKKINPFLVFTTAMAGIWSSIKDPILAASSFLAGSFLAILLPLLL